MVSASKIKLSQHRMRASRPYAECLRDVLHHTTQADLAYRHPYLEERPMIKQVGFIIISTDRGLCGGLNIGLFKSVIRAMQNWEARGVSVALCTLGRKAEQFFKPLGGNVIASMTHLGYQPTLENVIGAVQVMLNGYESGGLDKIYLAYNEFVNTMVQTPRIDPLLPVTAPPPPPPIFHWDYIYEPDARVVVDELLVRYVESLVYSAVTENQASEQSARMVAMKAASDNAKSVIGELKLIYNKARQAAITKEISEIVGGAAAV